MTHQLLISLDSFFPSPSLTQAISFNTIIFLSMFYQVFIICIIQPDQKAKLSSYHFFIRKQLQVPPFQPTQPNPSAFLSWWDLKPHQFAILYTHIINHLFFTFTRQFITLSNSYILLFLHQPHTNTTNKHEG
jgi:hypothetical protein